MADFDDILGSGIGKPTPAPFMDNPFEDVFADVGGRPRSPDPWSSGGWGQHEPEPAAVYPTSTSPPHSPTGFSSSIQPSYSYHHEEATPTTPGTAAHFEHHYTHREEPEKPAPVPDVDPLGSALAEPDEQPVKRNPFGPLPPLPKLADPAPPSPPATKTSPESPKKILEEPTEQVTPSQEIPPEVTPVAASQDTAPETPSIPVVTSAPVDHPLPPTPKEDVPEPQAPAIVETRASPVDTQPPHPSFSGPGSSASSFSRDRSESSATTESLSTAKYDRIVSPLESPATFSSRTPLDQSFSNLALGGEAPGWGSPIVHKTAPTEDSSPIDRHENNLSPSQSIATVKESENGPDGQEDTTTQRPLIQPEFIITVGDPQKVGDPISAHIVYTVTTRTTSPRFAKSSFSVLRRYSDFLWLYDMLGHNNPGVIIPPVPEKNAINRFDNTFVQSRRLGLSKCVQKIANHPVLSMDDDFKMFLESDSFALDIKHRRADNSNSGILGTLGSFTGPKFYEIDDWYDNKKSYLDALESQLKGLVKAIELVTKQRAEFATCVSEFAEAISALANSDLSKQLSGSLSILADVEKLYKEIQDKQSKDDALTIMATADEYGRLINSVRLAFGSRVKLYFACQQAETDARRIKAAHEKARRQGRIPTESMASSLAALAEADRKALDAKKEFDDVSRLIKTEMNRFERERIEDFKIAMDQFLDGMINKQKELVKAWEDYQDTLLKRAASNPSPQHPLSNGTQHQVQPETST